MDDKELFDTIIEDQSNKLSDGEGVEAPGPSYQLLLRKKPRNRPKISSNMWKDKNIVKLITEVEIRPCLWNVGGKDYKLRNKRDAAWKEIQVLFGDSFSPQQLPSKWQVLRTQYRSNVTNSEKTKTGQGVT